MFTFLIGPDKVRYNIHVSALKAISEPLGYMMTNGKMEESIAKQAEFSDIESTVFEQLVKFAYLGLCGIGDGVIGGMTQRFPDGFRCRGCGAHCTNDTAAFPHCSSSCLKRTKNAKKRGYYDDTTYSYCVHPSCSEQFAPVGSNQFLCDNHTSLASINSTGQQHDISGTSSTIFKSLEYPAAGLTHGNFSERLNQHKTGSVEQSVTLDFHTKVYILANKYLVNDLQAITLHKLHRHLANFQIEDEAIDEVIDLVLLTYTNTQDGGDILQQTNDKLRYLVMVYVTAEASALLKYENFRSMLGAGGAHTSDFMALKYAQEIS